MMKMVLKQRGKKNAQAMSNQSTRGEFTETLDTLSQEFSSSQNEKL
jgi:hypothetical protein